MLQALGDLLLAPAQVLDPGLARAGAAVVFRQLQQALGGVVPAVEDDIFHGVAQVGGQVVVNGQLAGVDDAHVHARADGVVQEHRVNRLAHGVIAAEGKRHVGYAA